MQKLKEDQGKLQNNLAELQAEQEKERNYLEELQSEITYELSKVDVDENVTSEEYKNKFKMIQMEEKNIVTNEEAVVIIRAYDSKTQKADIKQILRCFNSEYGIIIASVTV